ncbi:MAG: dephospho-CoA kinase [Bacteroidetes bacterium]|nr:MAG: dephospho-CoA kinase [Bacteroidota bacterium]
MLKVGLTGSIGSGKSTIAGVFRVLGIPVYVADDEARKILDQPEIISMVVHEFGSNLTNNDGLIDRKALAAEVFTDAAKLVRLNSIIHPRVRTHFSEWIEKMENVPYILQEAAIMYESGFSVFFDKIIVVAAPVEERIARVIRRDSMTRQEVLDRMDKQWTEEKKLERADYVIFNSEHSQAIPQVLEIHEHLCSISQNYN